MADVKDEEFDLTFLDEDGIDVDVPDAASTRLVHLDKDTEIPKRYLIRKIFSPHLEPPAHYHPAAEESQRRKKVHSKWGTEVIKGRHSYSNQDDLVALLSFENTSSSRNSSLDETTIRKVRQVLSQKSGDDNLEPLRHSALQLLIKFSSTATYDKLGQCFLEGKIEEISHLKLTEIQAVSLIIPPPCFIEIAMPTDEGSNLKETLSSLLVSHHSTFPFLSVREPEHKFNNGSSPSNSPASKTRRVDNGGLTKPAVGVMLMFTQRAEKNSESCLSVVRGNSKEWEQVNVPQGIAEGPGDEVYFKAANREGPVFAVKKLSPGSGVRIILFVNKDIDEVEHFYHLITGKQPLHLNKIEEGLSTRTFPLSPKLELQLVCHPALTSHPVKNAALCFMLKGNDVNEMCSEIPGGLRNIGEGHWQGKDPEGNAVILYSLLK